MCMSRFGWCYWRLLACLTAHTYAQHKHAHRNVGTVVCKSVHLWTTNDVHVFVLHGGTNEYRSRWKERMCERKFEGETKESKYLSCGCGLIFTIQSLVWSFRNFDAHFDEDQKCSINATTNYNGIKTIPTIAVWFANTNIVIAIFDHVALLWLHC